MSRLGCGRRSSGCGVLLGLDASLSDKIITSGDGVHLSRSTPLKEKEQEGGKNILCIYIKSGLFLISIKATEFLARALDRRQDR